jgi:hypothetical protein
MVKTEILNMAKIVSQCLKRILETHDIVIFLSSSCNIQLL